MRKCGLVKRNDCLTAWRGKGEMEARAWRLSFGAAQFDGELVAFAWRAISDRLIGVAGAQILSNPDIAERREGRVVEGGSLVDIRYAERNMMEQLGLA